MRAGPRQASARPRYDLIGDIHGDAAELEALLRFLGHQPRNGSHHHCACRFDGEPRLHPGRFVRQR